MTPQEREALKATVKEAAQESVGVKLDEMSARIDGIEERLAKVEGIDTDKAVADSIGKAMKVAGIKGLSGSQQLDDEDAWDHHSAKSSAERRDAFGRRIRQSA